MAEQNVDVIVGQLWIAFAKGAGATGIAVGAVTALVETCGPLRPDIEKQWDAQGKVIIDLARSFGERAAKKAKDDGSELIEAKHVEALLPIILVECPC